jgi:prolyl oligopeptidase
MALPAGTRQENDEAEIRQVRRSIPRRGWVLLLGFLAWRVELPAQPARYPGTPRGGVVEEIHGVRVADPYRWLEEADSTRTAQWTKSQAAFTRDFFKRVPGREAIRRRLTSLSSFRRTDVPWREAGRLFFVESDGSRPQAALYSQKDLEGPPRTVIDPNRISPDGSVAIREFSVSPNGRLLAYEASRGGSGEGEIRVRDLSTGRNLCDVIHGALTSACWTRDARGFFYVDRPASRPGESAGGARLEKRVRYHALGSPQSRDRLIREWKDARWVYCMGSEDGRYAIAVAEKGTESEIYVADLGDPRRPDLAAPWARLLGEPAAFHTPVDIVGRTLYVRTNLDAPRKRVIALDLADGTGGRPRTVIPESADVISDAVIAGDRLVVHYLVDVQSRLRLFTLDGQPAGEVALPGIGAVGWPLGARVSAPELFYAFTSFLAPDTIYRCDLRSGASVPFRPPRVPFDASPYETRQVFSTSKDGTRVPMFVTAARNLERDGTHPALLTGYGGYGITKEPSFEPDIPLFLEMGGVWAVANIRGGGEYGEDWHRAGMLDRKQNSFDDFFASAEYLISERYTAPGKLAIYGYSNGGLLVGAAITQRPELFAAAVGNAGHYDMLRYDRFTVGAGWITEYGSPEDPAAFRSLLAYSPLHNVKAGTCYPATLLLAADHDDAVVPGHAYKFAAALQAAQACDAPILLRVARNASHNYASRQAQIAERSDLWAFLAARIARRN